MEKETAETKMESYTFKKESTIFKDETSVLKKLEGSCKDTTVQINLLENKNNEYKDKSVVSQMENDVTLQKQAEVKNVSDIQDSEPTHLPANVNGKTVENLTMKSDKLEDLTVKRGVQTEIVNDIDLEMEVDTNTTETTHNGEVLAVKNDSGKVAVKAFKSEESVAGELENDVNTFNNTKNVEENAIKPTMKIKVEKNPDLLNDASSTVGDLNNGNISMDQQNSILQQENIKRESVEVKKVKRRVHKKKKSSEAVKADRSTVISNGKVCGADEMNNSLNQIMNYSSDSDSSDVEVIQDNSTYRQPNLPFSEDSENDSDSDLSTTSSSTSLFFSNMSDCVDSDEDDNSGAVKKKTNNNNRSFLKTKGELTLNDLPPVEDLKITVLEEECLPIGRVFQIVDQLVVVQSLKQTPVIDLESVLFLEGGRPLGRVFDVFGPVTEPYYCVRFNSSQQIKDRNIAKDQTVYVAPKTKHTSYVFVSHLLKLKGSDASWTDNNEPPKHCLDFSDDEQERVARKSHQTTVKTEVDDADEPVRKRPNAYEQRMNEINLRISARAGVPRSECRGRTFPNGRSFPKSEIIWPPAMSSSPQPPMLKQLFTPDFFLNNSPFPPPSPIGYQFGGSPFPPPSLSPFRPLNYQFSSSPLPPPSPVNHQFGSSPFQPPVNHQFGGSPLSSPINFGSSPFQMSINQFGSSSMPPPPPPPHLQFGNSQLQQSAKFQFGNSSANGHFGKAPGAPVNQQFGNSPFPPPPIVHRPPPAPPMPRFPTGPNNAPSSQFPQQGQNSNQFWTQAPVFPLQRNNFKRNF